jgi:hypothetical protein
MGGTANEEIALHLCWNIVSVPTYLRECFQEVGTIMASTLQGAFKHPRVINPIYLFPAISLLPVSHLIHTELWTIASW